MDKLKFSHANAKTVGLLEVPAISNFLVKRKVYSLDLLSGYTCPMAKDCLSKAVVQADGSRRIQDGPHTKFRCFSASQEVQYKNTFAARKYNFDLIRHAGTVARIASAIERSMPRNLGVCRIHVAGDFFNQRYFDAWLAVAKNNPDRLFYAYTKNLPCWIRRRSQVDNLDNFVLTASYGGKKDDIIGRYNLRFAQVVYSVDEAIDLKLPIDHDDSHAANPSTQTNSFALLIHGTQPKGSEASVALKALKGAGSYSRKGGAK